ncbi:MAG: glycosyltransferase [Verrucomicrobiota bacterium]
MPDFSLSVIIPTYNRIETLPRAIDSVLAQTRRAEEIVVVDDGSSDGTQAFLAKAYPQIKVIVQNNRGVSSARNAGIQAATSQWIALLDSDDAWAPDKLEQQIAAIRDDPTMEICHTEETWIFRGKKREVAKDYRKQGGWIFDRCVLRCAISPSSAILRKSLLEEVGYFDESFPFCEDYDLWLRVSSQYPTLLVDAPLTLKHAGHGDQLSSNRALDHYRIRALDKILSSETLNVSQAEVALEEMLRKCQIYRRGLIKYGKTEELAVIDAIIQKHSA